MKNFSKTFGIVAVMAVIVFTMIGCATNVSNWHPYWNAEPVRLERSAYTILGEVTHERDWVKIMGIIQTGGITYAGFLEEARRKFPETDAIIDVHLDCEITKNPFTERRHYIARGFAVKYPREVSDGRK